jgi:hypothetical protein
MINLHQGCSPPPTTMKTLSTLILCITLLFSGCSQPPSFKSTDISGADWGKGFTLTDPHGQPRRLADFKGKAVVVFFGYTQCPDVCPTTLSSMQRGAGRLGDDAGRVQVLFVTLDPARDTRAGAGRVCDARFTPASLACTATRRPPRQSPGISRSSTPGRRGRLPAVTASTTPRAAMSLTPGSAAASRPPR